MDPRNAENFLNLAAALKILLARSIDISELLSTQKLLQTFLDGFMMVKVTHKHAGIPCLLSKAADSIFAEDFYLQDKNIRMLVEMGHSGDGCKLNRIFADAPGNRNLLKIRHVLFEVNVTPLCQSHFLTIAAL